MLPRLRHFCRTNFFTFLFVAVIVGVPLLVYVEDLKMFIHFRHSLDESTIKDILPVTALDRDPYKIRNPNVCTTDTHLHFIVLVHSATANLHRRQVIRHTWGMYELSSRQFRTVFLLGEPRNKSEQTLIDEENELFNDIVQGQFIDTYHNLSHKAVLGLRWVSEHCTNVTFVVKIDDDVVLDVFRLLDDDFIERFGGHKDSLLCHAVPKEDEPIHRVGKWRTEAHPDWSYWPFPFCRGFIVIMTPEIVPKLYHAAKSTPMIWMDDVYFTGLLPEKIGNVHHVYLKEQTTTNIQVLRCFYRKDKCTLLAGVVDRIENMERIWKLIIHQNLLKIGTYFDVEFVQKALTEPIADIQLELQKEAVSTRTILVAYISIFILAFLSEKLTNLNQ